ncbi:MAG: hypothetical protein QW767_06710 [Thermoprotei archaeon]
MEKKGLYGVALALLTLWEYVLGGLVAFDDPSNLGFSVFDVSTKWPLVLPFVHRVFALVLLAASGLALYGLRGDKAGRYAAYMFGLVVSEALVGLLMVSKPTDAFDPALIVVHFSLSGLVVAASAFTLFYSMKAQ